MFWYGLIAGTFIGSVLTVILMSMLYVSKEVDSEIFDEWRKK